MYDLDLFPATMCILPFNNSHYQYKYCLTMLRIAKMACLPMLKTFAKKLSGKPVASGYAVR